MQRLQTAFPQPSKSNGVLLAHLWGTRPPLQQGWHVESRTASPQGHHDRAEHCSCVLRLTTSRHLHCAPCQVNEAKQAASSVYYRNNVLRCAWQSHQITRHGHIVQRHANESKQSCLHEVDAPEASGPSKLQQGRAAVAAHSACDALPQAACRSCPRSPQHIVSQPVTVSHSISRREQSSPSEFASPSKQSR